MAKRNWKNGILGGTPLDEDRLNQMEDDLEAALLQLARDPSQLFTGSVVPDTNGAPVSASVVWPDGVVGVYSGTASLTFPGNIDGYTITRVGTPTKTFTQPAVTRNANGDVTNRPAITIT